MNATIWSVWGQRWATWAHRSVCAVVVAFQGGGGLSCALSRVEYVEPLCGNGVVELGEQCDDGNVIRDDGCEPDCLSTYVCGNGRLEPGEECDAGTGNSDTGSCTTSCEHARCGDGSVQLGVEKCDLGPANSGAYGGCTPQCVLAPHCGDGVVNGPELCDPAIAEVPLLCSASCEPLPLLRYSFEGALSNSGAEPDHDGTVFGTVTYTSGVTGQAVLFSYGERSSMRVLDSVEPLTRYDHYTVALWAREDVVHPWATLLTSQHYGDGGGGFSVGHGIYTEPDFVTCYSTSDEEETGCDGGAAWYDPVGVWHHFIWRYDGAPLASGEPGSFAVFVDGAKKADTEIHNPIFTDGQLEDLQVGVEGGFYVDELRIYASVFSDEDQCRIVIEGEWDGTQCELP